MTEIRQNTNIRYTTSSCLVASPEVTAFLSPRPEPEIKTQDSVTGVRRGMKTYLSPSIVSCISNVNMAAGSFW